MGSDTDTRKNDPQTKRWYRMAAIGPDIRELDQILDAYWGGPERRITGLTLRIIGVNAIALIILIFGILYLSQYQNNLIQAKLETFKTRVDLVSAALVQSMSTNSSASMMQVLSIVLSEERILLFDKEGAVIDDANGRAKTIADTAPLEEFQSIVILKKLTGMFFSLLPDHQTLPSYPAIDNSKHARAYPDARDAMEGSISFSVWHDEDGDIFLSAAAPLFKNGTFLGVVLITRKAKDIEKDIAQVWTSILKIFALTTVITIILSIYLSGVIAKPLKRLARAAEGVRKGKLSYDAIPDMSERYDEIGELSIALRQMTAALGQRMDTTERFAADVAHELKNPLTSLRSAIETVSVVKKKADRTKLMDIIMHDLQRLDRLITDISEASRLDAALSREELQSVDLRNLLNRLLDVHKGPLERHNGLDDNSVDIEGVPVTLSFETQEHFSVLGLESRLEQVFQNLLTNALSFSEPGDHIHIHLKTIEKQVHITFEDGGPGIPENKLETIFDRFYSERPEEESYGTHSGLGLSICKQIIEAFGGQIFAENIGTGDAHEKGAKNTGARFTVILNGV